MTPRGHAKACVLKLIEETSGYDLERACKVARHQNNLGNKQDMTSIGHTKALVLKLIEETSRHDFEKA